jgi:hypothetical protein
MIPNFYTTMLIEPAEAIRVMWTLLISPLYSASLFRKTSSENFKGDYAEDLGIDGKIILQRILDK